MFWVWFYGSDTALERVLIVHLLIKKGLDLSTMKFFTCDIITEKGGNHMVAYAQRPGGHCIISIASFRTNLCSLRRVSKFV